MRWTKAAGLGAGLVLLSGCAYGYRTIIFEGRYSTASRPDASYYCYDCHGYRFFDPYYDWCAYYGFRYRWSAHPRVIRLYRERYVRIRETHPEYGRYRYRPGYRATSRYRQERDYEAWRRAREKETRATERPSKVEKQTKRKDAPKGRGERRDRPRERKGDEPTKGPSQRGGRQT